jgi:3-deoxy-D-manno-octulosonic-acid transferase
LVLPLLARFPEYKWVLVPHDVSESSLRFWEGKLPVPHLRWSDCLSDQPPAHPENARAIVVDAIGVLFDVYGLATFAYVGGGRSQGQHNFLEPLAWGVPTAIAYEGAHNRPDATAAADAGILHLAQDPVSVAQCWTSWQNKPPHGVQDWISQQAGATDRTAAAIEAWENRKNA